MGRNRGGWEPTAFTWDPIGHDHMLGFPSKFASIQRFGLRPCDKSDGIVILVGLHERTNTNRMRKPALLMQ